jgi:hypothetical protein
MAPKKSKERLKHEKLLIKYGLLVDNEIYNPENGDILPITTYNIKKVYNILYTDEKRRIESQLLKNKARRQEEKEEKEQKENIPQPQRINLEELITDGRRQLIELKLNDGTSEQFMLNVNTIEQINKLLNEGYRETEQKEYGSDPIFRANYIGITSYEIKEIMANHKIENKDGSFFNFLNTSKLDLTKYQILREEDDEKIIEEQCLLYTLKLHGISDALINNIKLAITNNAIPKKDIEIICDTIHKKIILHSYKTDNIKKTNQIYGKKYNETLEIALYLNHYFIYEETEYNKYFINNYEELKEIENCNNISKIEKINDKKYYKYESNKCNSLYLVHRLFNDGYFKADTLKLSTVIDNASYEAENIPLENIENEQRAFNKKVKEEEKIKVFFGDTETIVCEGEHKFLKLGVIGEFDGKPEIYNATDKWVDKLFNYVKKRTPTDHKAILYFHNLKYDFVASLKKNVVCSSPLIKDNTMYKVEIKHYGMTIELRDSYKLISSPLKDFQKIFKLDEKLNKKEAINYNFYNLETLKTNKHNVIDYIKDFNEEEKNIFYEAMKNKDFNYDGDTFNADKYYDYYLYYDVVILKQGLLKYREVIKIISSRDNKKPLDTFNYLTISSLAHAYMVENGAYDNVYELSGNIREFVSRAIYGGRVNVFEPIKCKVLEPMGGISDFDGVSLYPSSMVRMCQEAGLPKGQAKQIINKDFLNKDYYIIKIKINKINKKQKNPFIAIRKKDSIEYVNNINEPTVVYVDKITLEDYIKFHEIEYEFLDGIYWNEGYNKLLGDLVKDLFEGRKEHKKKGNDVIQNMIKLIMNSIYGKTITSKSTNKILYMNKNKFNRETKTWSQNNEALNNYLYNNFNSIIKYKEINETQVEITKTNYDKSYNLGHIGTFILSYSKRIMNEVMDTASNNNIEIYYQDTDSMHLNFNEINKLSILYKNIYNKNLIGEELGQFHTDFKLKGSIGEIVAKKSIFLGKKSYIDVLQGKNEKNEIIQDFHYRMKGATSNAIKYEVESNCEGDYFKLYNKLAKGEEIDFILNPYDKKVMFEYTNSGIITRKTGEFIRKMKF